MRSTNSCGVTPASLALSSIFWPCSGRNAAVRLSGPVPQRPRMDDFEHTIVRNQPDAEEKAQLQQGQALLPLIFPPFQRLRPGFWWAGRCCWERSFCSCAGRRRSECLGTGRLPGRGTSRCSSPPPFTHRFQVLSVEVILTYVIRNKVV